MQFIPVCSSRSLIYFLAFVPHIQSKCYHSKHISYFVCAHIWSFEVHQILPARISRNGILVSCPRVCILRLLFTVNALCFELSNQERTSNVCLTL